MVTIPIVSLLRTTSTFSTSSFLMYTTLRDMLFFGKRKKSFIEVYYVEEEGRWTSRAHHRSALATCGITFLSSIKVCLPL